MSLQIIYGRSGTGKTTYIFNDISSNINSCKKTYIITPEQFSFTAEKELLNSIKKNNNSGATVNAEVLTLNRMAHRVSSEVGGATQTVLSNSGKSMLIYNILSNKKTDLEFLGKSDKNVDLMLTQITELKKHNVTIEDLKITMENVKNTDTYLYKKLNDIYIIYNQYEEKINEKYIDENDALTILTEQLNHTKMFNNCNIYVDEFVGFTKQEYSVIEKLMIVANKFIVTICTDNLDKNTNSDIDIFYSNKQTANKLIDIAKANNIEIENEVYLENEKKFKNNELKHIEKNIFKIPYSIYSDNVSDIRMFLAKNPYSEIENVAKEIIELVRNKKYKYNEISIITQTIDDYAYLCKAIFNKYNIPVYIDRKDDLDENILIKYIISILDIFAKGWTLDSVFQYIKTGFTGLTFDEISLLEKYAIKWNIKGKKWYEKNWNFHDEEEIGKENIEIINKLREKIVSPLLIFKEKLTRTKTAKQISENIYYFLIENNVDKILKDKIVRLNELGELIIAAEYEASWKILIQILDEMVMIFGDEKINFENYMQLLRIGLTNSNLGNIPIAQDQVIIGDVDRSRNNKIKVVFIIGINDGSFPYVNRDEGFLNDNNRELLKKYGIELAKGTIEKLYEDNFNIYKTFTAPEEKLFLSYVSSNLEGKTLRSGMLIHKIKKMFPKLIEESDVISTKINLSTKSEMFDELLLNLKKLKDNEKIDDIWFDIYSIINEDLDYKYKLKNAIGLLNSSNIPEILQNNNIDKLYADNMQTSISKLERYRSCPFSYFLKYNLKLNDKDESKIESVDTGSFMHDVIDSFFELLDDRSIGIKDISDDEIESIINEIIDDKLKLNKNYIFETTAKYRNLAKRLKKVVIMSIKFIIQTLKQSSFEIYGNEVEFSNKSKYKPIKVSTDSGKTVEITGKIDRIDVAKTNKQTYVRIIDYKSSIKDLDLNKVVAGLQLQLLTYLTETCKIEDFIPAGVLYFNLYEPNIKNNKNLSNEDIEAEIKKQFKMQGLILADVNIIKMMDNDIENTGTSNLIPATIKSNGEISESKTKGITLEQFNNLQNYIRKIIKQISEEIFSGKIDIEPYYNTKVTKGKTACEYCKYKTICKFDVKNKGNNYNYINNLNKDILLDMIKK